VTSFLKHIEKWLNDVKLSTVTFVANAHAVHACLSWVWGQAT